MEKYRSYFIFLFCHFGFTIFGQSERMLINQAQNAMANKDWFGATQYYNRLYQRDSSGIKLHYNFAEASRLAFDLDIALRLYKRVVALDNAKKYPLSYYWIAQILKNKAEYKDAKMWFTKFSKLKAQDYKRKRFNFDYYHKKSKIEIEACDLARILIKNPSYQNPEHLEAIINSKMSEFAAFEKDSTLYFSTIKPLVKKEGNELDLSKIYKSEIKKSKWTKLKVLDTLINSPSFHNANTTFSADGKLVIVSRCKEKNASEYSCELFLSNLVNKKWQNAVKMEDPINLPNANTTQANLSEIEGKTVLFFASDRPGGEGGLDIWYSFRNGDGSFSKPINAGKQINTVDDEISPWFVSSKNTLFFSSTYHKGLGAFDIFKSVFKNNEFGEVQNAGYPLNSGYNDIYYSQNTEGTRIYLSSNRLGSYFENKLNCCNDIYRFHINAETPLPVIDSNLIVKEQIKLLVPLTLYFHNDEPDPKTKNTSTSKSYEAAFTDYKMLLPQYQKEFTNGLKGDVKTNAINTIQNFFTDSVDAGMDDLKRFSDLLEKVLLNGETVKITMKGYCSPLASSDYNVNLAKRRISSLRNYFIQTKNGFFTKYVDNQNANEGKIIFEDVEVGELIASKASDDFKDKRNSIYSPYAASERKIQIIAVSFGKK